MRKTIFPLIVFEIMLIGFFTGLDFAYGESDFILEASVNHKDPNIVWEVTKFAFSGESEKEICPSSHCSIDSPVKYIYIYAPRPDGVSMGYDVGFRLQDNITNAELGPKKKEFVEQFTVGMFDCRVNDIIEENGQELYYCHGDSTLTRNFDSKTWNFNTIGIYDAKIPSLKLYGNFTKEPEYSFFK